MADNEAKKASEGKHCNSATCLLPKYLRNSNLLQSISALLALKKKSMQTKWSDQWKKSPRYLRTNDIDPSMPSSAFIKLTNGLPKHSSLLMIQFRTCHVPLNLHLHRIGKAEHPNCPICPGIDETISHFLFNCPQYRHKWHLIWVALRRNWSSISYLLTSNKALLHLIQYVNSTRHFKSTFSKNNEHNP